MVDKKVKPMKKKKESSGYNLPEQVPSATKKEDKKRSRARAKKVKTIYEKILERTTAL